MDLSLSVLFSFLFFLRALLQVHFALFCLFMRESRGTKSLCEQESAMKPIGLWHQFFSDWSLLWFITRAKYSLQNIAEDIDSIELENWRRILPLEYGIIKDSNGLEAWSGWGLGGLLGRERASLRWDDSISLQVGCAATNWSYVVSAFSSDVHSVFYYTILSQLLV